MELWRNIQIIHVLTMNRSKFAALTEGQTQAIAGALTLLWYVRYKWPKSLWGILSGVDMAGILRWDCPGVFLFCHGGMLRGG